MPTLQLTLVLSDRLTNFMVDSIATYLDPLLLPLSDNLNFWQDSDVSSNFFPSRSVKDSLNNWADAITTFVQPGIGLGDDMGVNWQDVMWSNFLPAYQLKDTMTMTDAVTLSLKPGAGFQDTLTMSDAVVIGIGLVFGRTMSLADSIQFTLSPSQIVTSDFLTMTDAFASTFLGTFSLSFTETLVMADSALVQPLAPIPLVLSDQITFKDNFALVTAQNAIIQLRIGDSLNILDQLVVGFLGNAIIPNTSTGSQGNVSISANGNTLGTLLIGNETKFLYQTLYRYANLDIPFSPNDPGLAYAYDNTAEELKSVPLAARFFNLLDEVSDPLFFDVGSPSASGLIIDCIDVRLRGAKGDGITNDTAAIQKSCDEAHENYLNAVAGVFTGPTRVCIPSGLVCMVGGGFWTANANWPLNPANSNSGNGPAPPAGAALAGSNTVDGVTGPDACIFVRSGVTIQLDGTVKIITDPTQFIGNSIESSVFCFYDNDFKNGRSFPSPTYIPPAKGIVIGATIQGNGMVDGSMAEWLAGSTSSVGSGLGFGIYALVGNNSQFLCTGITVKQTFGIGIYVEGNINAVADYSNSHIVDCVVDTFGSADINGGFIGAGWPVMSGIAVWANGVGISRNRVVNGTNFGLVQQYCKAYFISGKSITLATNDASQVLCGIWVGSYQRLSGQNQPNGGADNCKITDNTLVGTVDSTLNGIVLAATIGDPPGEAHNTPGVLNYISGLDIGDNTVSSFNDGLAMGFINDFNPISQAGGLFFINVHDNNFNNNRNFGIEIITPAGGFKVVNLWGNMLKNDGHGGISVNGNVDGLAITTPTPGLGTGSDPGTPGTINVGGVPLVGDPGIYEVYYYFEGNPDTAEPVLKMKMTRKVTFPANFITSTGSVSTLPTATAVYNISKNGVVVGTITISTGGVFTFATTGGVPVPFQPLTDTLLITAPSPNDITLAGVEFTLVGSRLS